MLGLLVASLVLNYLFNIAYAVIFVKYMQPLIHRPKQTDHISHTVILVLACLTNYRFGLLVYSRLCDKPRVNINTPSQLTPVHYLCICTTFFDILTFVACGVGIYQAPNLTPIFMLSLDLLIIIIINILVTVCFVVSSKPDDYYQSEQKYEVSDNITKEDINPKEESSKDASNINIKVD